MAYWIVKNGQEVEIILIMRSVELANYLNHVQLDCAK